MSGAPLFVVSPSARAVPRRRSTREAALRDDAVAGRKAGGNRDPIAARRSKPGGKCRARVLHKLAVAMVRLDKISSLVSQWWS